MKFLFTHNGYDYYFTGKKSLCHDCFGTGFEIWGNLKVPCVTCNMTGEVDEIISVKHREETK